MTKKKEVYDAKNMAIKGVQARMERLAEWCPNIPKRAFDEMEYIGAVAWQQGYEYGHRCGINDADEARSLK